MSTEEKNSITTETKKATGISIVVPNTNYEEKNNNNNTMSSSDEELKKISHRDSAASERSSESYASFPTRSMMGIESSPYNFKAGKSSGETDEAFKKRLAEEKMNDPYFQILSDLKHPKQFSKKVKTFCASVMTKTFATLFFLFFLIGVGVAVALSIIFPIAYTSLEKTSMVDATVRVQKSIQDNFQEMYSGAVTYAYWDDFYYALTGDLNMTQYGSLQDFMADNFSPEILAGLFANYLIVYNLDGNVAIFDNYDSELNIDTQTDPVNAPKIPDFLAFLDPQSNPLMMNINSSTDATNQGYIYDQYSDSIVAINTVPILHSDQSGPPAGLFLFGRQVSHHIIQDLANTAQNCLTFEPVKDQKTKEELTKITVGGGVSLNHTDDSWTEIPPYKVVPLDNGNLDTRVCWNTGFSETNATTDRVAAFTYFDDFEGNPVFILRIDGDRLIVRYGIVALGISLLSMLFVGIIAVVVIVLFIQICVLKPLKSVSKDVLEIAHEADVSKRVRIKSLDELGIVAYSINKMLHSLDKAQRKLNIEQERLQVVLQRVSYAERRNRSIMNSIPNSIITILSPEGTIIHSNSKFESEFKYKLHSLEKSGKDLNISDVIKDLTVEKIENFLKEAQTKKSDKKENKKSHQQKGDDSEKGISPTGSDLNSDSKSINPASADSTGVSSDASDGISAMGINKYNSEFPVAISANQLKLNYKDVTREAYVVVIRNMSSKLGMLEDIKLKKKKLEEMEKIAAFDGMMRSLFQRIMFQEFCRANMCYDNYLLYEDIEKYRALNKSHERLKKQEEIKEKYLAEDSLLRPQLPQDAFDDILFKLTKAYGQADLFDELLSQLKNWFINNVMEAFIKKYGDELENDRTEEDALTSVSTSSLLD